jgi:ribosomal protein L37AE/L43A
VGGGIDGDGGRARRSHAARVAGRRRAQRTQCPACHRKNATKRVQLDPWHAIRVCRYCKHEWTVMNAPVEAPGERD